MSDFINEQNITLEPCDIFYGKKGKHTVTTVADTAGSLDSTYFEFDVYDSTYTKVEYYAWFNVDAGGTDPSVSGKTGIEVTISSGDTAATVASALQTALDAIVSIEATVSSSTVTYNSVYFGLTTIPVDGVASTGFTFATVEVGKGGALGSSQGDIEIGFEPSNVEVNASQTGAELLDLINNGTNVTVSMTLQELTGENLQLLIGSILGQSFDGTGDEKYFAIGESKRFKNLKQFGGELILKPVGSTDDDRNHNFYATIPSVESFTLSGESVNALPVTFNALRNTSIASTRNKYFFGDVTKLA